tara:strand:- start:81 stop:191 length:111 start_codon:yes stop_codon:yes gene_type:complete
MLLKPLLVFVYPETVPGVSYSSNPSAPVANFSLLEK